MRLARRAFLFALLGLAGAAIVYLGVLLANFRCAYNDSGRPCDPGSPIGRWLMLIGAGAIGFGLLRLAWYAGAGLPGIARPRGRVKTTAIVIIAGVPIIAVAVLILRAHPAT